MDVIIVMKTCLALALMLIIFPYYVYDNYCGTHHLIGMIMYLIYIPKSQINLFSNGLLTFHEKVQKQQADTFDLVKFIE